MSLQSSVFFLFLSFLWQSVSHQQQFAILKFEHTETTSSLYIEKVFYIWHRDICTTIITHTILWSNKTFFFHFLFVIYSRLVRQREIESEGEIEIERGEKLFEQLLYNIKCNCAIMENSFVNFTFDSNSH